MAGTRISCLPGFICPETNMSFPRRCGPDSSMSTSCYAEGLVEVQLCQATGALASALVLALALALALTRATVTYLYLSGGFLMCHPIFSTVGRASWAILCRLSTRHAVQLQRGRLVSLCALQCLQYYGWQHAGGRRPALP
jgi:hypothetical protein